MSSSYRQNTSNGTWRNLSNATVFSPEQRKLRETWHRNYEFQKRYNAFLIKSYDPHESAARWNSIKESQEELYSAPDDQKLITATACEEEDEEREPEGETEYVPSPPACGTISDYLPLELMAKLLAHVGLSPEIFNLLSQVSKRWYECVQHHLYWYNLHTMYLGGNKPDRYTSFRNWCVRCYTIFGPIVNGERDTGLLQRDRFITRHMSAHAALHGQLRMIQRMAHWGEPLQFTLPYLCSKGFVDALEYVLDWDKSIDINYRYSVHPVAPGASLLLVESTESDTVTGMTSMHVAASHGSVAAIECLLKRKARLESLSESKDTPLSLACAGNHTDAAIYLLGVGASPCAKCLNAAVKHNNTKLVSYLMMYGLLLNSVVAKAGITPLENAASAACNIDILEKLIESGARSCYRMMMSTKYSVGLNRTSVFVPTLLRPSMHLIEENWSDSKILAVVQTPLYSTASEAINDGYQSECVGDVEVDDVRLVHPLIVSLRKGAIDTSLFLCSHFLPLCSLESIAIEELEKIKSDGPLPPRESRKELALCSVSVCVILLLSLCEYLGTLSAGSSLDVSAISFLCRSITGLTFECIQRLSDHGMYSQRAHTRAHKLLRTIIETRVLLVVRPIVQLADLFEDLAQLIAKES